jgi:hypothetical protein
LYADDLTLVLESKPGFPKAAEVLMPTVKSGRWRFTRF